MTGKQTLSLPSGEYLLKEDYSKDEDHHDKVSIARRPVPALLCSNHRYLVARATTLTTSGTPDIRPHSKPMTDHSTDILYRVGSIYRMQLSITKDRNAISLTAICNVTINVLKLKKLRHKYMMQHIPLI